MPINIDDLNETELLDLNRRIVARLHFLAQMRAPCLRCSIFALASG